MNIEKIDRLVTESALYPFNCDNAEKFMDRTDLPIITTCAEGTINGYFRCIEDIKSGRLTMEDICT